MGGNGELRWTGGGMAGWLDHGGQAAAAGRSRKPGPGRGVVVWEQRRK